MDTKYDLPFFSLIKMKTLIQFAQCIVKTFFSFFHFFFNMTKKRNVKIPQDECFYVAVLRFFISFLVNKTKQFVTSPSGQLICFLPGPNMTQPYRWLFSCTCTPCSLSHKVILFKSACTDQCSTPDWNLSAQNW